MKKMCGKKPGGSRIFNATIYNVEKYHRALKIFKFVVARHFSNQRGSTKKLSSSSVYFLTTQFLPSSILTLKIKQDITIVNI